MHFDTRNQDLIEKYWGGCDHPSYRAFKLTISHKRINGINSFFEWWFKFRIQWCNVTLTWQFWVTKVCLWVSKTSKICLVTWLGMQLLEKHILKIILHVLWLNGINSCQYNTGWAILLFVSDTGFCCQLVLLKVMPHHAPVSCLIIRLTINPIELKDGVEDG